MAKRGLAVIKPGVKNATQPKDYFMLSENVLLKIHKQGSFKLSTVFGEGTVTINFPEMKGRPLVLVYAQRFNHDGDAGLGIDATVDNNYHLLDWSYFGATIEGYTRTKIYNNKFVMEYLDQWAAIPRFGSLLGYYYVFEEQVGQ